MADDVIELGKGRVETRWLPVPVYDRDGIVVGYGVEGECLLWDLTMPPLSNGQSVAFTYTLSLDA